MRKITGWVHFLINTAVLFVAADSYALSRLRGLPGWGIALCALLFAVILIVPSLPNRGLKSRRLRICADGCELLRLFLANAVLAAGYHVYEFTQNPIGFYQLPFGENVKFWIWDILLLVLVEAVVFWDGILRIYMSSSQLGVRWRVLGIVCGWIPIVNLFVLAFLIRTAAAEVKTENDKLLLNESRKSEQICKTKYPLLMVHGVFFRDFRYLNYWGRIPEQLTENGASVYYGNQQSAASVEECGRELAGRIEQIVSETGCGKVNIIAHSKGGLDSRYAIAMCGASQYVASLTTINTPHRGCEFADYLLGKIPEKQQKMVADAYNTALEKLGDQSPDFISAVTDLTASACKARNETVKDADGVFYQSIGSKLNQAMSGRFPLNFTYRLVQYFDGKNDGLVGEESFPWGESYRFLVNEEKRGISHGDMIDLNRENLSGFDVREFYVQLVADLKNKGF
ncbi:MAG: triacylglycerol lipase [Lachnospiraceae bacterium]|nr:triacylglycerol lipase [Lachnospiraceae bacterium]